jgi:DnaK suppressor protein
MERQQYFRELLNSRMEALLSAAGETIGELTGEKENPADAIDIAAAESNREFTLRLQDRDRRLVGKIRGALKRVTEGEYGECISCGEDISERRLLARPVATFCIDCKTEAEQMERRGSRWGD